MTLSQATVDTPLGGRGGADSPSPPSVAPTPASASRGSPPKPDIRRLLGLSVPVTVILAERDMTIASLLSMSVGTIIEFEVTFDSELSLQIAGRPIGVGHAAKVGENFGLRVTKIGSMEDRIDAMGHGG